MGDLGLPGSVVTMPDDAPQKALWEVRKAGLNIMMSLKGDGKPVSFIEDCAVPLEHLAEYTDALTEVFRATAPRAPGTPMRRWARCMCGRSWTCGATAP
jgi:FAD/FMN-containing dehydrogenase